jgi:TrmH family RNA methyltransferase
MIIYDVNRHSRVIKLIINLNRRNYRDKKGLFFVEGERILEEAINSDYKIKYLICSQSYVKKKNHKLIDRLIYKGLNIYVIDDKLMEEISDTVTPQGIIAVVEKKIIHVESILNSSANHFLLIVDGVRDPGNLGTIIRTAHACGVNGVFLIKGTVDQFNPKVLRSAAGSIFHVPILMLEDTEQTIIDLKKAGINIIISHLRGDKFPFNVDLKKPIAIVVGNEAFGVNPKLADICNNLVKIPMPGNAESLNVAVAAGILMYEVVRQRLIGIL